MRCRRRGTRLAERLLALLALTLLVSGCGRGGGVKASRISWDDQAMLHHEVRDDRQVSKREQYQEILRLAGDRFGRDDLDAALKYARSAQRREPGRPDAYTLQAVIQARLGKAEEAGALYRKAAELAPGQGDVLNNYGAWLCGNGHPAEALIWFDRALADSGYADRADALANAGGCALDAGQRERAESDLRQALALAPGNAYALASMARNEFLHGRYFEARAFCQRRLAAAPATASVLQLAIEIEERLGDGSAASRYQQRLREEFPESATPNPQG